MINKARRLPAGRNRALVEEAGLIAPTMPSAFRFACEQLQIWTIHKALDALSHIVGLTAVFPTRLDDQLAHVLAPPPRLPSRG